MSRSSSGIRDLTSPRTVSQPRKTAKIGDPCATATTVVSTYQGWVHRRARHSPDGACGALPRSVLWPLDAPIRLGAIHEIEKVDGKDGKDGGGGHDEHGSSLPAAGHRGPLFGTRPMRPPQKRARSSTFSCFFCSSRRFTARKIRVLAGPLSCPPRMAASIARWVTGRPERGLRVSLGPPSVPSAALAWRLPSLIRRSSGRSFSRAWDAATIRRVSSFFAATNCANLLCSCAFCGVFASLVFVASFVFAMGLPRSGRGG